MRSTYSVGIDDTTEPHGFKFIYLPFLEAQFRFTKTTDMYTMQIDSCKAEHTEALCRNMVAICTTILMV